MSETIGEPEAAMRTASAVRHVPRVLRVQLAELSQDARMELRELAREAARFGNAMLADKYMLAMGYRSPEAGSAFVRCKGRLSGDVRVSIQREAEAIWRRHRIKILAGEQRLALFEAERALVCRGSHRTVRHRRGCQERGLRAQRTCECPQHSVTHAWIRYDGERYWLSCSLSAGTQGRREYPLAWHPALESSGRSYVTPVLDGLASRQLRLLKVSFQFERAGKKVFALLAYEKTIRVPTPGQRQGTLGPLEEDGSLWLRLVGEDGRPLNYNYTAVVHRLAHMKQHFAGIHRRLKRRIRRSGPGWRRDYRLALVKAGSFSEWAEGVLHQVSREIVERCRRAGVGYLAIGPLTDQDLPMAQLQMLLDYKAAEAGIILGPFDPAETSTERAVSSVLKKRDRRLAAKLKAIATLRDNGSRPGRSVEDLAGVAAELNACLEKGMSILNEKEVKHAE